MKIFSKIYKYLVNNYIIVTIVLLSYAGLKFGGFYGFYINGDGKGYYAYLPATFIYHDFNFSFINAMDEKYYPEGARADFRKEINGNPTNKYFVGLSVLWLPFFLLAHCVALITGAQADGYSTVYQYAILIAALFYLWLGLFYLRKILNLYAFDKKNIIITTILIVFATPLVFYTILNPDWTHLYSFTLITMFLYFAKQYTIGFHNHHLLKTLIILGFIIIIRPVNGMVILSLPFISGRWVNLVQTIKTGFKHYKHLLLGFIIISLLIFLQLMFYRLECGKWLIWSYTGEGFNFAQSHFIDVLFSYRRGLFIYTPITFLCLFGFYALFRKSFFEGISLLLFLIATIYMIASWHCWWYGMCFSLRPITEFLPYFAILLAYILTYQNRKITQALLYLTLTFTLIYNSILIHQYRLYIIHWDSMDSHMFWKVFMRTNTDYAGLFWGNTFPLAEENNKKVIDTLYREDYENKGTQLYIQNEGYMSNHSIICNKNNAFVLLMNDTISKSRVFDGCALLTKAIIKLPEKVTGNTLHWVLSVNDSSGMYLYQCFKLDLQSLNKNTWYPTQKLFKIEGIRNKNDIIKIYLWNPGNQKIFIDNTLVTRVNP